MVYVLVFVLMACTQARETFAERKQATDELTRVHKKNRAELNALQETLR
jgi:hypothetical protein